MSTVRKVQFPDHVVNPLAPVAPATAPVIELPPLGPRGGCRQPLEWKPMAYMDEYLENLKADNRVSTYIVMVRVGLIHFSRFAAAEGLRHPDEIERQHILRFQTYLMSEATGESGQPFKTSYRQRLMGYVRSWINWMDELDHIENNPWIRIRVGVTSKQPKPLEDEEIAALFDAHRRGAFTATPFMYHRREVILVLLYAWGLRIHELQALNVSQMDMRLEFVRAKNKGQQGPKPMPYSPLIKAAVQRWLVWRASKVEVGEDALLIDFNSGTRMSINRIRDVVYDLGDRAGVTVNPHRFRDTFGTILAENDVEIERIMQLMGHTKREQTLAYTRLGDRKVKEEHQRVIDPLLEGLLQDPLSEIEDVEPPPGWPGRADWESKQ